MAYTLDSIDMRGRDNSPGGKSVFIALVASVESVDFDETTGYITGVTMASGATDLFYEFQMPRENINFTNNSEINIPAGTFIFKPMVTFNLPGLQVEQLNMFDTLVRKTVMVIVKTNEEKYYVVGHSNGVDLTSNSSYSLGTTSADAIGSTIELEGLESKRIAQIDPTTVDTILATITE